MQNRIDITTPIKQNILLPRYTNKIIPNEIKYTLPTKINHRIALTPNTTGGKNKDTQESLLSNYNDPNEINSFADVLFNKYKIENLGDAIKNITGISALETVIGSGELLHRTIVKPLIQGEVGTAGLNALMNVGETLDIIANPVKAITTTIASGGDINDVGQALLDSVGWGGNGRKNFDYELGDSFPALVGEIVLEIISDPGSWLTLGGAGVLKAGAKGLSEVGGETLEQILKRGAKEISEEAATQVTRRLGKESAENLIKEYSQAVGKKMSMQEIIEDMIKEGRVSLENINEKAIKKVSKRNLKRAARHGTQMNMGSTKNVIMENISDISRKDLSEVVFKHLVSDTGTGSGYAILKETMARTMADSIAKGTYQSINTILEGQIKRVNSGILKGLFGTFRVLDQADDIVTKVGTFGIPAGIGKLFNVLGNTKAFHTVINSTQEFTKNMFKHKGIPNTTIEDLNKKLAQQCTMFPELAKELGNADVQKILLGSDLVSLNSIFVEAQSIISKDFSSTLPVEQQIKHINELFRVISRDNPVKNIDEFITYLKELDIKYQKELDLTDTGITGLIERAEQLKKYMDQLEVVDKYNIKSLQQQIDNYNKLIADYEDETLRLVNYNETLAKQIKKVTKNFVDFNKKYTLDNLKALNEVDELINYFEKNSADFDTLKEALWEKSEYLADAIEQCNTISELSELLYREKTILSTPDRISVNLRIYNGMMKKQDTDILNDIETIKNRLLKTTSEEEFTRVTGTLMKNENLRYLYPALEQVDTLEEALETLDEVKNYFYNANVHYKNGVSSVEDSIEKYRNSLNILEINLKEAQDASETLKGLYDTIHDVNPLDMFTNNTVNAATITDNFFKYSNKNIVEYTEESVQKYLKGLEKELQNITKYYKDFDIGNIFLDIPGDTKAADHFIDSIYTFNRSFEYTLETILNARKVYKEAIKNASIHQLIFDCSNVVLQMQEAIDNMSLQYFNLRKLISIDSAENIRYTIQNTAETQKADFYIKLQKFEDALEQIKKTDLTYNSTILDISPNTQNLIIQKRDNTYTRLLLNNNQEFKLLRENPGFGTLCNENVVNNLNNSEVAEQFKEIVKAYKPNIDEIELDTLYDNIVKDATIIAKTYSDINRFNSLYHNIMNNPILAENTKAGFIEQLEFLRGINLINVQEDVVIDNLIQGINGFKRSTSTHLSRTTLDEAFADAFKESKDIALENVKQDVERLLRQSGITDKNLLDLYGRHSAITDTVMLAHTYKQTHPNNYIGKCFMDTETTSLFDGYGRANGKLTEISILRYNAQGDLEVVFNKHVSVSEKTFKEKYDLFDNVLESMGINRTDYKRKLITTGKEYTEKDMLVELSKLNITGDIVTFNGDAFDIDYITKRYINNGYSKKDVPLLQNNSLDYFLEYQDKKGITKLNMKPEEISEVKNILQGYISSSKTIMDNFIKNAQYPIESFKLIDGIDGNTIATLYDLADQLSYDESIPRAFLDLQQIDKQLMDNILVDKEYYNAIQNIDLAYKTQTPSSIFRKAAQSLSEEYRHVNTINKWLATNPIDFNAVECNEALFKKIAEVIDDPIKKEEFLNMKSIKNFSQLLYAGTSKLPGYAYYNISMANTRAILDLSNTKSLTPEMLLYLHQDFVKPITELSNSAWNLHFIEELPKGFQEITDVLNEWKSVDNYIKFPAFKYINTSSENLAQQIATLEVYYNKLKNIIGSPGFEHPNQKHLMQLVEDLKQKHPQLYDILENPKGTIHARVYQNTDIPMVTVKDISGIELPKPEYTNIKMEEGKLKIEHYSNATKEELQFFRNVTNKRYNKTITKKGTDMFTATESLQNFFKNLYDSTGKPVKDINKIYKLNNDIFDVYNISETMQVMQLEPKAFRDMLVEYGGEQHCISLGEAVTSNKYILDQISTQKAFLSAENIAAFKKEGIIIDASSGDIKAYLDPKVYENRIKLNKNSKGSRFCLDGNPIQPVLLKELDEQSLRTIFKNTPVPMKYSDELIEHIINYRKHLLNVDPSLAGRSIYISSEDSYMNFVKEYMPYKNLMQGTSKIKNGIPYTNTYVLGSSADRAKAIPGLTNDPIGSITMLTNRLGHHIRSQEAFTEMLLESMSSIDNIFEGIPDEEIIRILNSDDRLALVYLRDDDAYVNGYLLDRVTHVDANTLKKARELDARVISYSDYEIFAEKINNFDYNKNVFLKTWHKVLIWYKKGFLMSVGTVFRNVLDSSIKMLANGDDLEESALNLVKGYSLISKFEYDMDCIRKMDPHNIFKQINMEVYYKNANNFKPKLDKDTYKMIYDFMMVNGANSIVSGDQSLFGRLMKAGMGRVEDSVRLAQYLNLKGQGLDYDRIIKSISDTHFNYAIKSKSEIMAELFIPFYSFNVRNLIYFTDELLNRPGMLQALFNIYTPIWDFDSQDYYELSNNQSLQYQIIAGNIPLQKLIPGASKQITLKTGISILDTINMFANPISNISNKLAPPISLITNSIMQHSAKMLSDATGNERILDFVNNEKEYRGNFRGTSIQSLLQEPGETPEDTLKRLNEIVGVLPYGTLIQRINSGFKNAEATKNPLNAIAPSIFGATTRFKPYKPYTRKPRTFTKRSGYSQGRRYIRYPKKVYTKKYYSQYNKNYYKHQGFKKPYIYNKHYPRSHMPYSDYSRFLYKVSHPNYAYRPGSAHYNVLNKMRYNAFQGIVNKKRQIIVNSLYKSVY